MGKLAVVGVLGIIVIVFGFIMLALTSYSVGVAEVGIIYDPWSGHFREPVAGPIQAWGGKAVQEIVHTIPISIQTIELAGSDFNSHNFAVFVLSKDNLEIEFELRIRFNLISTKASDLFVQYPDHTLETVRDNAIIPGLRSIVRDVIAEFNAVELQENQALIQKTIIDEFKQKLDTEDSFVHGVNLVGLDLTDINLPQSLKDAIQAKINAQQDFIRAGFEAQRIVTLANAEASRTVIQATADAQRQVIFANATATQRIIEAFGTAQAQLTVANATALSLDLIATQMGLNETERATLTNIYVFFQQLQAVAQANPNIRFFFFLGDPGSGTFIQLPAGP